MPRPFMTSLTRLDSPPHRWIGWRSTGQKPITWQFPELPDPNGVIERELIADGTVTAEQLRTFEDSSQAWQDEIWTAAADRFWKNTSRTFCSSISSPWMIRTMNMVR